jgi:hypothetical protein
MAFKGGGAHPCFNENFDLYVVKELELHFETLHVHSLVHDTTSGTASVNLSTDAARKSLMSRSTLPFNLPLPDEGLLTVSLVFTPDEDIVIPLQQKQQALSLLEEAVNLLGAVVAYQHAKIAIKTGGIREIRRGAQDLRTSYIPFLLPGRERVRNMLDSKRAEREEVRNKRRVMIGGAVKGLVSAVGGAISSTVTGWLAGGGQRSSLQKEALPPLPPASRNPHEDLGRAVVLFARAQLIIPGIPNIDTAQLGAEWADTALSALATAGLVTTIMTAGMVPAAVAVHIAGSVRKSIIAKGLTNMLCDYARIRDQVSQGHLNPDLIVRESAATPLIPEDEGTDE